MYRRILVALMVLTAQAGLAGADDAQGCFWRSLHARGEGMRYWYEEAGGLKNLTGIPYSDLDCSNCHVRSCDTCHGEVDSTQGTCGLTLAKAQQMQTCLKCHSREGLTFKQGRQQGNLDVHIAAGQSCANCHTAADVHGDGTMHRSMRDPGALKTECVNCHDESAGDIRPHKVHQGKLACAACHVANTTACMNCHMDTFLQTGQRAGNFIPVSDWLLLINYEGQVTSGTAMTLVHKNRKFICYGPYFTHAIQAKGKECADCHANDAVRRLQSGEGIPMMRFVEGRLQNWSGVVPVVAGKLDWVYLNKQGGVWTPVPGDEPPLVQYVAYGSALSEAQLRKLAMPVK